MPLPVDLGVPARVSLAMDSHVNLALPPRAYFAAHSHVKVLVLAALLSLLCPLCRAAPAPGAVKPATPTIILDSQSFSDSEISPAALKAAIADLRHDPNLGGQTKRRTLRWVTASQPQPPPTSPAWIIGLFDYIAQFGGLLLWIFGAVGVAVAAIWILRVLKSSASRVVPVQPDESDRQLLDLDIRPISLPDDVSAAAIELLRAGSLRECLSLLYRASLSAAVHRFGVTVGAQHTEREVLKAVKVALDEPRARYFADLVATWQRMGYAGEVISPEAVLPFCAGFSTHFGPT